MQQNLTATLQNSDSALLPVLAKRWHVNIQNLTTDEIVAALAAAMTDPVRLENVWNGLEDTQRGALQMLLGSGGKMAANMFERLFGEIRKMGAGRIEREKPHEHPLGPAEALYYRGLIAETFEQAAAGARAIVYIPPDLAAVLPSHKSSYDAATLQAELKNSPAPLKPDSPAALDPLENVSADVQQADTSIVDDMTTLLAYLQLYEPPVENDRLSGAEALLPHLLKTAPARLDFLFGLALSADLVEVQQGKAYTKRAEARRWLSGKRAEQLKTLAEGWRNSVTYADLWHVPGLYPEPAGWRYEPLVARAGVFQFMRQYLPQNEWWSLDEFIILLKETNPDFQRPGGDYDSWYIRNDAGEYLRGFESWDAVEGALLEFYVTGIMHWLGLVDLAEDAARLTVYGRAFLGAGSWPNPPETDDKIIVQPDGALLASRKVSRIDRFQLARFCTWVAPGDTYVYQLEAESIARAAEQGINTGHISAFIQRFTEDGALPPAAARLLAAWQTGPKTSVSIEQLLVLRTSAPETLDMVWNDPALRRFLGARLGPMAVIVRADQWEALRAALGEQGISVALSG